CFPGLHARVVAPTRVDCFLHNSPRILRKFCSTSRDYLLQSTAAIECCAPEALYCGLQQAVQRLLHASSHHPVQVVLDPLVVNRDDSVQRSRCSLGHGASFSLTWLRLAASSFSRFGAGPLSCGLRSVQVARSRSCSVNILARLHCNPERRIDGNGF